MSAASSTADRNRLWARLGDAVAAYDRPVATPAMVVDLDAFDANAADLARRAGGTPIRVASKSLRVPALIARALAAPGFAGVLGYTLAEALWLVERERFQPRRLVRDTVVALLAFAYSVWAIAGAGDDIVTKGFVLMLAGVPVYVGMRWWQKRNAEEIES